MRISRFSWILISVVFATFASKASAQDITPRYGAKLGAGFSRFSGDVNGAEFGLGFGIGPSASFDIDRFSIATDLLFNYRSYDNTAGSTTMWEVSVPIAVRFYPHPVWFVELGGFFSYGLGSVTIENAAGESQSLPYDSAQSTRSDFGAVFGGGADFAVGENSMQSGLRLNWGFKDRTTDEVRNIKTLSLDLYAAYYF